MRQFRTIKIRHFPKEEEEEEGVVAALSAAVVVVECREGGKRGGRMRGRGGGGRDGAQRRGRGTTGRSESLKSTVLITVIS